VLTFILRFKHPLYLCCAGSDTLAGMLDTLACLLPAIDFSRAFYWIRALLGSWREQNHKFTNSSEWEQGTESKVHQLGCSWQLPRKEKKSICISLSPVCSSRQASGATNSQWEIQTQDEAWRTDSKQSPYPTTFQNLSYTIMCKMFCRLCKGVPKLVY
jgi:hypothetical protein